MKNNNIKFKIRSKLKHDFIQDISFDKCHV